MTFSDQVYEITKKIPKGKVATYGQLAFLIGKPNASRAVGNALHRNPYEGIVPCHRVVNSKGELACEFGFGGSEEQKIRLEVEGVEVVNDKVDLEKYQWDCHF